MQMYSSITWIGCLLVFHLTNSLNLETGPRVIIGDTEHLRTVATSPHIEHGIETLMRRPTNDDCGRPHAKIEAQRRDNGCINSDFQDSQSLHLALSECIDSHRSYNYPDGDVINVVTGFTDM